MQATFQRYDPKVIRRDVANELAKRLQALRDQAVQQIAQASREMEPAPASH